MASQSMRVVHAVLRISRRDLYMMLLLRCTLPKACQTCPISAISSAPPPLTRLLAASILKTYLPGGSLIVGRVPLRCLLRVVRDRAGGLAESLARWLGRHRCCCDGTEKGRVSVLSSSSKFGLPAGEIEILPGVRRWTFVRSLALCASPRGEQANPSLRSL